MRTKPVEKLKRASMTVVPKYEIGQILYSVLDPERNPLLIVNITLSPGNAKYGVSVPGLNEYLYFYEFELTAVRDYRMDIHNEI